MVGQMRFEGIGKAEFEMPPSTISQHVTQPKMSATPEDRVLNSQTGIDKSVVGPLANGWTGSRTQSRANTEQTGDAPPGLRAAERSLDTSLPRLSSGQQANADKMGLASFVNEEVRQGSKQPESRIAPPESDIRLAPQQVVTPPSSFGQPTTFVTRDALRPTSKGEDIGKVNFEHVPEMRQDARIGGAPTVLTQLVKPEMSQTVIRQMTDAVRAQVTAEKSVEISLRPAELGRVRIALSPADAGMIVSISAERAETLEMMRRNIDDLARSFAEMGHENLTFSFEQNGAFDHKDDQPMYTDLADENVSTDTTTELENQTPIPVLRTQNTGVDILV